MINVNMTDKAGVTLATAGKYCADNVKVTPSAEILRKDEQAKTATPTTSAQDITPDAGKALSKVTVNPITAAIVGDLDADSFAPAIVSAVEGKGVTVPDGTLLNGMASLIESIETGGGGVDFAIGSVTPADQTTYSISNPFTITHNLGRIPTVALMYTESRPSVTNGLQTITSFITDPKTIDNYGSTGLNILNKKGSTFSTTGGKYINANSAKWDDKTIALPIIGGGPVTFILEAGKNYYWLVI